MRRAKTVGELTQKNVETIALLEKATYEHRTLGEKVADWFAATIGSWPFIIGQSIVLGVWIAFNVFAWIKHWDPYPFILLNLALSFQAAYASPIIMMSQNRQARLDERRNHLDLQINLLSEQENTEILRLLRMLCEKQGIGLDQETEVEVMEQATKPEELIQQIECTVEQKEEAKAAAESNAANPQPNAQDKA
ncbi:MAG: DUF1003 domain-containing protein [Abitibacteriaceae bacterium]|nr:DUF1003 domain-containing protein [Abditibacteriaceae bacterium]MBV9867239.1 DUF1003 domain-containing protein [Abditibacteriaceae bacterium]